MNYLDFIYLFRIFIFLSICVIVIIWFKKLQKQHGNSVAFILPLALGGCLSFIDVRDDKDIIEIVKNYEISKGINHKNLKIKTFNEKISALNSLDIYLYLNKDSMDYKLLDANIRDGNSFVLGREMDWEKKPVIKNFKKIDDSVNF